MPGEDGYALIHRIRARGVTAGGTLAAIALTAYAAAADRDRATEAGYDAHVAKPFDPLALSTLVRDLINSHASMR